jgi:hypothetical protein
LSELPLDFWQNAAVFAPALVQIPLQMSGHSVPLNPNLQNAASLKAEFYPAGTKYFLSKLLICERQP